MWNGGDMRRRSERKVRNGMLVGWVIIGVIKLPIVGVHS